METLKVSREEIKHYEKLKVISQIALVKEKINSFERKYRFSFEEFQEKMRGEREENFEVWDDYIEWKAYANSLSELETKRKEIENARHIRIT